jgi:hypothetical protein
MGASDVMQLQEPLKEGGIRSVNFFNGRLLSSKDLTREQAARRESDWRLGLAVGDGVAFGLEVAIDLDHNTQDEPVVKVKAGLAINRKGQALRLSSGASVALKRSFDAVTANCLFSDCLPIAGGTYVRGAGVYVLTIAPAELSEGKAPTNGLDPTNVRCNTDTTIEAVQFRLVAVNSVRFADLDPASLQFRNRLAYRCFGIEARDESLADPWRDDPDEYGLVDTLRQDGLTDYDVPIALVYWTSGGIQYIDAWAVRRALLAPDALGALSFVARRRRLLEAQAMCAQFQDHIADLLSGTSSPATIVAVDHFRWLPPFGIVPLQSPPLRGFFELNFFSGIVRRPAPGSSQGTPFIDARALGALRERALAATPTDLTLKEFVWVYRPWQTAQAAAGRTVQPMVAFASGLMPDFGLARFDMSRFEFSNYVNSDG